ncbi:hypothetical protein RFI_11998 [Reticulomyxa filosa]|uniref:Pre-mRNA-splicing factor SLU7 n=1 Tax=Reticulomyxa filosa TaxID=46433 RepID=X6NHC2_RETFI|nr:hypothetical protein RFI_11998 [Reticulomyxa filosa]|eukprot:ETO25144.1 hypothetical protein RFI_11998 [Reticulomyxa filosa]
MERADEMYHGDNMVRVSGDAVKFSELKRFAWDTREVNPEHLEGAVHLQANPTLAEKAYRSFQERKKGIKNEHRDKILQKYGGEEHLQSPQKELLYGQSEAYAEYSHDGRVIHGLGVFIPKSKYNEDIYPGNHKSVWGSWYNIETGEWGYACCHVTHYQGYCTGQTGIDASERNDGSADQEFNSKEEDLRQQPLQTFKQIVGVAARPKELTNKDKLVNPSGYVSTRGYQPSFASRKQRDDADKKPKQNEDENRDIPVDKNADVPTDGIPKNNDDDKATKKLCSFFSLFFKKELVMCKQLCIYFKIFIFVGRIYFFTIFPQKKQINFQT